MQRLLFAAILAPLCYFASLLVAGWLTPAFSHVTQLPSDLGADGAPAALIFNLGLGLTGLLLSVAGLGLSRAAGLLGAGRISRSLVLATVGVPGIYFVLIGLIPLPDPRHNALFPLLLPLQFGPIPLALGLRSQRAAGPLRRYLLLTAGVLLGFLAVALGVGHLVTEDNQGLFIRLYALLAFSWVLVAGALLKGWLQSLATPVTAAT